MLMKKTIIGRAELIDLPEHDLFGVPAKTDTGAKTSAIWATDIQKRDGGLVFKLFGPQSSLYTGEEVRVKNFQRIIVASSIGKPQRRYKVRLLIKLRGKRIRANFTLADRSSQAYPVLIGRNVLRGKYLVDVQAGKPDYDAEKARTRVLQNDLKTR